MNLILSKLNNALYFMGKDTLEAWGEELFILEISISLFSKSLKDELLFILIKDSFQWHLNYNHLHRNKVPTSFKAIAYTT